MRYGRGDRGGFRGGRDRDDDYGGGGRGYGSFGGGGRGGDRGDRGGSFEKPVKEGQEYDISIEAVGAKGDGIGKVNNFVVFVAGGQQGDRMRIRITRVFNRFAVGEKVGEASQGGASAAPAEESGEAGEEPAEEAGEGQPEGGEEN